jgi:hypothetical protein
VTLDDFLPSILPNAKGCPAFVANQATRLAIIEWCTKSMIWRHYQQPVTTVALQTAYAYAPTAGQQVITLLSMTLAGGEVAVVDPQKGRTLYQRGEGGCYAYGTLTGFELRPAQAAALSIVSYSVVAPSNTATTVPDAMGQYLEDIADGALYRLLKAKDKTYSDMPGAVNAKTRWDEAIAKAMDNALKGGARVATRTSQSRF